MWLDYIKTGFSKKWPKLFLTSIFAKLNFFYLVSMFRTTPSRCFLLYLRGFLKKVESPSWAHFYCCFIGEYHILEVFFVFNSFQTPLQSLLLIKCRIRNVNQTNIWICKNNIINRSCTITIFSYIACITYISLFTYLKLVYLVTQSYFFLKWAFVQKSHT